MVDQEETSAGLEELLEYLRASRGFDFTGYRRSGLGRRITKRMQAAGVVSFADYQDYMEVHPNEFAELFNTILINVSGFFRDEAPWQYLQEEVLPQLVAEKHGDEPVRVWSAGCAGGQEAYTLVMVLAEALGVERARELVKIYATDVDEDALEKARQARYSAREMQGIPPDLMSRYFEAVGTDYAFNQDLRRSVIFGRHDLTKDAPISRIDLLACRNTLMYFNAETQAQVLDRLHFALRDGGVLLLGRAETLLSHANLFTPIDLQRRMFRKVVKSTMRDRLMVMADMYKEQPADRGRLGDRLPALAFQGGPDAQLVVDASGLLSAVNDRARTHFKVAPSDIGRPFHDLDLSFRPVELRSRIQQAYAERRPVVVTGVEWPSPVTGLLYFDVQVMPLSDREGRLMGASVSFTDVSRYRQLQEEVQHANRELETAYAELQSANEELETTNEELQSTVEELETTNEELQSTNEELETMNEELQSTNEELQTINDELGQRTSELNEVNAYLESILSSLRGGVVVLDEDLRIRVWNHLAEELWGIRPDEAQGQYFLNLDFGLPVQEVHPLLQGALSGQNESLERTIKAVNRRGRTIPVRVTCNALRGSDGQIRGVFVLMEPEADEPAPAAGT